MNVNYFHKYFNKQFTFVNQNNQEDSTYTLRSFWITGNNMPSTSLCLLRIVDFTGATILTSLDVCIFDLVHDFHFIQILIFNVNRIFLFLLAATASHRIFLLCVYIYRTQRQNGGPYRKREKHVAKDIIYELNEHCTCNSPTTGIQKFFLQ